MKHFAVLGESLSHTLSPDIHSRIFKLLGLDCSYGVLEVSRADFKGIRNILTHKAYSGINVTIPYKELIIPYLDHISPEASRIGAVNTVSIEKGLLTGYNTDYYGFKLMLKHRGIEVKDKDITVFGSGGGAKAVIAYLIDGKAKSVNVVSRNKPQLLTLKERFREINILTREHEILGDVAVNCTPVGMYPHICNSIIDSKIASSFEALVDLVYNPV
ncbi:MAG: shikimate dehydrogenase, partial [Clostridiales bacterium]|nr:shikimate dehydrogenase [Clostridiales bacterium]